MRFGCCLNMLSTLPDGTGVEWIEVFNRNNYDYVELPLAQMMALDDEKFEALKERVLSSGLPCEACNNFFPGSIRLTGPRVDMKKTEQYLMTALDRAQQLGVKTIVFGSSRAKNVPEGFPMDQAWKQLIDLLRFIDDAVKPYGITIAIEPLNRQESNIINTYAEGLELAEKVARDNIRVLVDYYHLAIEKENPEILLKKPEMLQHVHFAKPEKRVFPKKQAGEDYSGFFSILKQAGYEGRISVEAYTGDLENDACEAIKLLRNLAG